MEEDGVQRLTCDYSKPSTEWNTFLMKTEAEIKKHILSMPTKHCSLDPIPTWLIKECLDELESTSFLSSWKEALVTSLIKKSIDGPICTNYRPVSNLTFTSKVIE